MARNRTTSGGGTAAVKPTTTIARNNLENTASNTTPMQNGIDLDFDPEESEKALDVLSDAASNAEPSDDDIADDYDMTGMHDDSEPDAPDDVEEELQRLVFGDNAGFRSGIKAFASSLETEKDNSQSKPVKSAVPGFDEDFFVMDTGGNELVAQNPKDDGDSSDQEEGPVAAWEDSDDERLTVSLASVAMLRKLRKTEAEDVVSGREYIKRLRRRYVAMSTKYIYSILMHAGMKYCIHAQTGQYTLCSVPRSAERQTTALPPTRWTCPIMRRLIPRPLRWLNSSAPPLV